MDIGERYAERILEDVRSTYQSQLPNLMKRERQRSKRELASLQMARMAKMDRQPTQEELQVPPEEDIKLDDFESSRSTMLEDVRMLYVMLERIDIKLERPRMVVIGQQSSGKSSVIERIVGYFLCICHQPCCMCCTLVCMKLCMPGMRSSLKKAPYVPGVLSGLCFAL